MHSGCRSQCRCCDDLSRMSEKDLALEYAPAIDTASNRFTIRLDSGPIRTDSRPQKRGPSGRSGLREHKMDHGSSSEVGAGDAEVLAAMKGVSIPRQSRGL